MNILFLTICLMLLGACSSTPYKVVESMNDDSKPSWTNLEKVTWKDDGKVYALGFAEAEGSNVNLSALARVADNNGKVELGKLVSNEVSSVMQNTTTGVHYGGDASQFLGSEKSKVLMQELGTEKRYYQTLAYELSDDKVLVKTQYFSLVSLPEKTYKKLLDLYGNEFKKEQTQQATEATSDQSASVVGSLINE
jgi:hypothetical protein